MQTNHTTDTITFKITGNDRGNSAGNGSINRSFMAESVPGGGLFLGWQGSPSGDGRCTARLVLGADGHERTVKSTVPGCP
jgi:hypothetical protein